MDQLEEALTGALISAYQGDVESCLRIVAHLEADLEQLATVLEVGSRLSARMVAMAVRKTAPERDSAAFWVASRYVGPAFAGRSNRAFRDAAGRAQGGVPVGLELEGLMVELAGMRIGPGGREQDGNTERAAPSVAAAALRDGRPRNALTRRAAMTISTLPAQGAGGELEHRIHDGWVEVVRQVGTLKGKHWVGLMLGHRSCVMGVEEGSVLRLSVPDNWIQKAQREPDVCSLLMDAFSRVAGQRVFVKFSPRDKEMVNPTGVITGEELMARAADRTGRG